MGAMAGFLQSLSTAGLVIVSIAAIIFALAKFGVLTALVDKIIGNHKLSTGISPNLIKGIEQSIEALLDNDKKTDERLSRIEAISQHRTDQEDQVQQALTLMNVKISSIEKSQYEYKMESYKKTVFNNHLPLIDRMAAGIKFMIAGGNSETKKYLLKTLSKEDLVTWNGLCKALGALEYWVHDEPDKP